MGNASVKVLPSKIRSRAFEDTIMSNIVSISVYTGTAYCDVGAVAYAMLGAIISPIVNRANPHAPVGGIICKSGLRRRATRLASSCQVIRILVEIASRHTSAAAHLGIRSLCAPYYTSTSQRVSVVIWGRRALRHTKIS